ncbi:MAG TPA: integrase, partial [Chloroflexi bacterium]|nr:integrase [Chloroflexota bacterium]
MTTDDTMTITERRKYLTKMQARYRRGDRHERGALLTEMEAVTGMHRKSLTRLMAQQSLTRMRRRTQRGAVYGSEIRQIVRIVWESLDCICAERLTPQLLATARHLAIFGEIVLTPTVAEQLGAISESTVTRMLRRMPRTVPRLPRHGPAQANRVLRDVPIGRIPWQTTLPGWCEVDLVHHCGESAAGEYVHTLQLVDVATGWSERAAVLGRGQAAMEGGFRRILARLPFRLRHLHPDNGSEFFNDHLVRFFGEEVTGLTLSRSRPYQKNDNRFVEQKNDTLVRAYLGHQRLDTTDQCNALNALYAEMGVYYNLFQPVLHLIAKEVIAGTLKRTWDEARTPYQRLAATNALTPTVAAGLAALHTATNPRQLRQQMY